jgi:hypothetical protein
MVRLKYLCLLFSIMFFLHAVPGFSQSDSSYTYNEDTPDSLLDFRLSYSEFMHYYGTDDTSKAMINMFFRKRSLFATGPRYEGLKTCCVPAIVLYLTSGVAMFYYGIREAVNCTLYSRQALLYALIDRENGYPLPPQFVKKLESRDFKYH